VNTERGVEFELKNRLDDARLTGFDGVAFDGESVPIDDVTIHREGGTVVSPADISASNPLQFDLGETVQVVCDRPRLRRGSHDLTVDLAIEGFGGLSFSTDDEVTEEDLVDADPADYTVAELREFVDEVRDPLTLDRLLDREREGKNRRSAIAAIERRCDDLDPVVPSTDDDPTHDRSELGERTQELLSLVVETPQQVQVYTAGWVGGRGTADEIAERTLFTEERVQTLLGELELQDLVERDGDEYEMVHPIRALQQQPRNLWQLVGL
jgi:hypothetical protein